MRKTLVRIFQVFICLTFLTMAFVDPPERNNLTWEEAAVASFATVPSAILIEESVSNNRMEAERRIMLKIAK